MMSYKPWPALKAGDIIEIVAPGFGCAPEIVTKSAEFVRSLGYVPRVPQDILGEDTFSSNTDEYRFNHLKNALLAEDSRAIWCIKGGYGSPRLIPYLETLTPPKQCKLMIGFSDITAIHLFLQQRWGWSSLHAKMLFVFCREKIDQPAIDELVPLLSGERKEVRYSGLEPLNEAAKTRRVIHGVVTGGNLSLLQVSIGTTWQLESAGKILFIEEIGERGYRIDRKLEHMRQAGLFKDVPAIVIGDMTEGQEPDGRILVEDAILRFAASTPIPVMRVRGIGHDVINHPLPLGTASELVLGTEGSLQCLAGSAGGLSVC
jgi:muramoyltetrapeptide carboxypeptidase